MNHLFGVKSAVETTCILSVSKIGATLKKAMAIKSLVYIAGIS